MTDHYVLYIEHDDRPHGVSVHSTLREAEIALMKYSAAVLGGSEFEEGTQGIFNLAKWGEERVRVYECHPDGSSRELAPFLHEAA